MNLTRQYAHEVVTDVMHNRVPNLLTAQRARDQNEVLREINIELISALRVFTGLVEDDVILTKNEGREQLIYALQIANSVIGKAENNS